MPAALCGVKGRIYNQEDANGNDNRPPQGPGSPGRGCPVISYRTFRNDDPPALVRVWNESLTGRGAVHLPGSNLLEQQSLALPYFDPAGLILAIEANQVVGFVHAGFGANQQQTGLAHQTGVICMVAVRPAWRRQGIGGELLRRAEEYLRQHEAQAILAGPAEPNNPFYHGLYGGSDQPGFLVSDELAGPFFQHHGYETASSTVVFQRALQKPLKLSDYRFVNCRQQYEIATEEAPARPTWWQNSVLGMISPVELTLSDKKTGEKMAEAQITELEAFSARWHHPSVGISHVEVTPESRRQGLGKFLMMQVLRFLQEQCFELAELQVPGSNDTALLFFQQLGFEQVDTGKVYRKK
jgi:ribosomal protein S18 acetylase RimI-like enzyme